LDKPVRGVLLIILNAPHKVSDSHLVVFLCPSRRFDVHESSDHPFTADKEIIQPFLNAGLAFLRSFAELPRRGAPPAFF
jgi:hypothetical protein